MSEFRIYLDFYKNKQYPDDWLKNWTAIQSVRNMIDERADSNWDNVKAVAPFTGAWIEIVQVITLNMNRLVSHPSRVRGLKFTVVKKPQFKKLSHPSRVRGLKYSRDAWL